MKPPSHLTEAMRNRARLVTPEVSESDISGGLVSLMSSQNHALISEWELWQMAARRSARTVEERIRVIAQFAHETGLAPHQAQSIDIIKWLARHTDWSESTNATYYSYLRSWFSWLCIMDYRTDNPMTKLAAPRYPDRVPRPVTDDGLTRLLTQRMHHRTRVMILLAALAGLRVSEIAKVRGDDFDLGKPALYVLGKGGKRHALPLHPCSPRRY